MKKQCVLLVLVLFAIAPSFGYAIPFGSSSGENKFTSQSFAVTGVTLVLTFSIGLGGITTTVYQVKTTRKKAKLFLKENATALAQDVNMGGGHTLRDFATIVGVKPTLVRPFMTNTRKRRHELLPCLSKVAQHETCVDQFFAMASAMQTH